ncbi:preprotein translocase subunit YajC [Catenovulum agarivorans DS-2]|uniref:Sec translocon accessory complex subunit YajC n=1 Tax=Catenovulum agarivorans DS-2 TaxID=1328313 RepID=W7R0F4_9ALTE|nr:preprotein translocase subunit YajC [Catenovulum agarivorans]EWH11085.1 preprotein translocase subunit YajC [Catenovulum agarivorans DS-2]
MDFLIANAYANGAAPAQGGGMQMVIMLVVFGLIFYFMLYRPQAKRMKEHKSLIASIGKGDEVLTQGGLVGRVSKVSDEKDFILVTLADGVDVAVQKSSVTAVLPKGTIKSI